MKIGSLFSGYGGLTMGIQSVLGGDLAWNCDYDAGPSKVLAHHHPDVPNLRDVTAVDWHSVEPVDVIEGGSPCQDVSQAGKRAGMRAGTRSGLWASMCDAIEIIRPGLVVWENVRGALSAAADSDVEPCPLCVGDGDGVALRALGRVVGDLHELGYVGSWRLVRASDAGAPHARARVFVAAWPAADTARDRRERGWSARQRGARPAHHDLAVANAGGERHGRGQDGRALGPVDDQDASQARERERAREVVGDRSAAAAADAQGYGRDERRPEPAGLVGGPDASVRSDGAWGAYAPAIARWERILGRSAPTPTEGSTRGGQRLSPAFVEWLMGLPAGHVTAVPGLTRNEQLKLLGNGVVPQQSALALRQMLAAA